MAILPQMSGLEVKITDDQKHPLYEYDNEDDEQTPLEAEGDQRTYEMTSETSGVEYGNCIEISVDGCIVRKLTIPPNDLHTNDGRHVCSCKHEYRNPERFRRGFQFADLEVGEMSDDSGLSPLHGNIAAIGTISVTFFNVKNVRSQPMTTQRKKTSRHTRVKRLNEKSMKGDPRSHTFTLGERRATRPRQVEWLFDHVNEEELPFAKYHFKYRSMAALRSLCIAPRSPSPTIHERRPEDNMSRNELIEMVRQLQASTSPAKREPDQYDAQNSIAEHGYMRSPGCSVDEAIDLTGED